MGSLICLALLLLACQSRLLVESSSIAALAATSPLKLDGCTADPSAAPVRLTAGGTLKSFGKSYQCFNLQLDSGVCTAGVTDHSPCCDMLVDRVELMSVQRCKTEITQAMVNGMPFGSPAWRDLTDSRDDSAPSNLVIGGLGLTQDFIRGTKVSISICISLEGACSTIPTLSALGADAIKYSIIGLSSPTNGITCCPSSLVFGSSIASSPPSPVLWPPPPPKSPPPPPVRSPPPPSPPLRSPPPPVKNSTSKGRKKPPPATVSSLTSPPPRSPPPSPPHKKSPPPLSPFAEADIFPYTICEPDINAMAWRAAYLTRSQSDRACIKLYVEPISARLCDASFGCCNLPLAQLDIAVDSKCAAAVGAATLNGVPLGAGNVLYSPATPNHSLATVSFKSLSVSYAVGNVGAMLCFPLSAACPSLNALCGGAECLYAVQAAPQYKCCPSSIMTVGN